LKRLCPGLNYQLFLVILTTGTLQERYKGMRLKNNYKEEEAKPATLCRKCHKQAQIMTKQADKRYGHGLIAVTGGEPIYKGVENFPHLTRKTDLE